MTPENLVPFISSYVWPVVLAWNAYLFGAYMKQERDLAAHKLFVAENYISKRDLEKMFSSFEERIDERLSLLQQVISNKGE